jgi:uncharacterized protein (DUF952 family)
VIFHVARRQDWEDALAAGEYVVSSLGRTLAEEGFIHASHRHQVDGVLERYYGDVTEPLVLLGVDPDRLGAEVREEPAPGTGESFPHIYGPIPVDAVVEVSELPDQAGSMR